MRRRRHHITVLERVVQHLRRDEPARVRDVRHERRAVFVCGRTQGGVVPVARVGGGAADDEARLEETGLFGEFGVVDELGGGFEAVGERLEVDRGGGDFLLCGLCWGGCMRVDHIELISFAIERLTGGKDTYVVSVREMTAVRKPETHDPVLGVDKSGQRGKAIKEFQKSASAAT
jgi:hypothetical protein